MLTVFLRFLFSGGAWKDSGEFRQFGFFLRSRRLRCFEQVGQPLKLAIEILDPSLECQDRSLKPFIGRSIAVARQAARGRTGKIRDATRALSDASIFERVVFFL